MNSESDACCEALSCQQLRYGTGEMLGWLVEQDIDPPIPAATLEQAMPWPDRIPPLHVSSSQ